MSTGNKPARATGLGLGYAEACQALADIQELMVTAEEMAAELPPEQGEQIEAFLQEQLVATSETFVGALEAYLDVIDQLKARVAQRRETARRADALARADERAIEQLKGYLAKHLKQQGLGTQHTLSRMVYWSEGKPAIALKPGVAPEELPAHLQRVKVELSVSAARAALDNKADLSEWVELGEPQPYITVR